MIDFALGFLCAVLLIAVYTFLHLRWTYQQQSDETREKVTRLADGTVFKNYKPDNERARKMRDPQSVRSGPVTPPRREDP